MRPFSQKTPFAVRDIEIQGNSVRKVWAEEPAAEEERRPIRREAPPLRAVPAPTRDALRLRIGEELDYVRRLLDVMGDQLSGDPILIRRHAVALQSLDLVGQILNHLATIVRSSDPKSAVEMIGMSTLKARLTRSGAL